MSDIYEKILNKNKNYNNELLEINKNINIIQLKMKIYN